MTSEPIFEFGSRREIQGREDFYGSSDNEIRECIDAGIKLVHEYIKRGRSTPAGGYAMGLLSSARELERRELERKSGETPWSPQ